jgi:post-segregation antitoxin (ccd killing protein)
MITVHINLKLELSDDVKRKAREAGLFTSEKMSELIEAQVKRQRQEAWEQLQAKIAPVQAAFHEEFGHLSDDEVQTMIDQWVAIH